MKQIITTITANSEVMPGTHLMRLESPPIAATARPGQYVMVSCGEDTYLRRPISIHQVNREEISLLFKIIGKGTHWLSQRKTGDKIDIFGPLGNGFTVSPNAGNLLLVAGGMGIAPLHFLADVAISQNKKVTLLMGCPTDKELLPISTPRGLITNGALPFSINVVNATEDGTEGFKGLVTQLIADYMDFGDQIFACGPVGMYKAMAQMPELKNKPVQISLEIMMGCGVGVCYGCTIRTKNGLKQVCQDGPVFNLEDIIWDQVLLW
ncbi:dihydroorotate dehydrogenase electron transfer subunit [Chloroflexota bacterium]